MLGSHTTVHKHQTVPVKPVRPVTVAACRQREMMIVIAMLRTEKVRSGKTKTKIDITGLDQFPIIMLLKVVCHRAHHTAT